MPSRIHARAGEVHQEEDAQNKKDVEGKPIAVGVINVLVTPQQAEILSLAANQTTIQLVLRNPPPGLEFESW